MQVSQVFTPASTVVLLCVGLASASTVRLHRRETHPIEQVIGTLQELGLQVEQQGRDEEVVFMKFDKWCVDSARALNKGIAGNQEQIASLTSAVQAKTEAILALEAQVASLDQEKTGNSAAQGSAQDLRNGMTNQYDLAKEDLDKTIQAIADVLTILEGARGSTDSSLLQTKLQRLSLMPLVLLEDVALLRAEPNPAEGEHDRHVKEYAFKSHSVIELLKKLKIKFEDDRTEAIKAETNSANSFELASSDRTNAFNAVTAAHGQATAALSLARSAKSSADIDLSGQETDLGINQQALRDTNSVCGVKRSEWGERSTLRQKEVAALETAVGILQKVSGVQTTAPDTANLPAQPPAGFLAVAAHGEAPSTPDVVALGHALFLAQKNDPKMRAVNLLREVAKEEHSRVLERFAQELAVHLSGPFDAINNMIQKMIFRLHAEQKNENDHKHWCDTEVSKTEASSASKDAKAIALSEQIVSDKAASGVLADAIGKSNQRIADLNAHSAEVTDIRTNGKAQNAEAIKDAKAAQEAISKAIAVVTAYYKDSGKIKKESWESFVQQREPVELGTQPAMWGADYTGVADPKNQPDGIITLLEGVAQTFSEMQANTAAQESADQAAFDGLIKDNKIETSRLQTEVDVKTGENNRLLAKVANLEKTKKHVSAELEATDQYLEDLKPACLDGDSSYEDRKAARKSEIDALGEAQQILADAFKEQTNPGAVSMSEDGNTQFFLVPVRRLQR